jgi:hypothetical protein
MNLQEVYAYCFQKEETEHMSLFLLF